MGHENHSAEQRLRLITVYVSLAEGEVLKTGYAMCYKHDAPKKADASTPRSHLLGRQVTKPKVANLGLFAGIVHRDSNNFKGSGTITLVAPQSGNIVSAFTDANMVVGTTHLGPQDGSWALGAKTAGAVANVPSLVAQSVALAAETVDTDTVNANKLIKFL